MVETQWVRVCLQNVDSEARDRGVSTLVAAPFSRAEAVETQTTKVEKGPIAMGGHPTYAYFCEPTWAHP